MSSSKRIVLVIAVIGVALIAAAGRSEAQGRRRAHGVVVGYYANPYWFYDPWWGYGYQPYPYPPYPPYRAAFDAGASMRLEATPKEAEVYLDGYYAGIVDDFDGTFQRLRAAPGEHDLTLYRDGYRTVTQHIYLTPGSTFRVKYAMERLAPGETPQPRPAVTNSAGAIQGSPGPVGGSARPPTSATGTLDIRVQPIDADVLIDGQPWRGGAGQDRLTIDTSAGRHTVQISKSGYVGYLSEVQVRPGETTTITVSLRSQP